MEPDLLHMLTLLPDYSLPNQKKLGMVTMQQEMNNAQLTLKQPDYSAYQLIWLLKPKYFPNFLVCKQEQHAWDHCEHLNYVQCST